MLKIFNDFERRPDLLARFDALLPVWSVSCVFADVMYRTQVMTSAIKPPFKAKAVGQAVTVQLSKGDLVDPLKALEMGQPGDMIVVAGQLKLSNGAKVKVVEGQALPEMTAIPVQ